MKHKVELLAAGLVSVLSSWDGVECVAVGEHSRMDILDPYFALVLDVYCTSQIPDSIARLAAFGNPGAFESARGQTKDRFFLEGLPVRVEYKRTAEIDRMLGNTMDYVKLLKNSGTYPLYRLQTAAILYDRSGWIAKARNGLESLGEVFWTVLRQVYATKMEHYFSDLASAIMSGDDFYYLISAAGFARFAAATLFMANWRFEPSHREIDAQLRELPSLPADFMGSWDNFIVEDHGTPRARKRGLAEAIAKSVVAFT